jgi:ribosomal-protein-serine acetyltransferase
MFPIQIDENMHLRPFSESDARAMYELILHNRDHLDRWLRWSGRIQTLDDTCALIERFATKYAAGDGFHAGIWEQDRLIGGLVCHYINRESSKSEIGYWLGAEFVGRGKVTRACRAVIAELFEREKMHRIEIQCAVDNRASRAVAERLGFRLEGIKRESEWITMSFRDHALYSLLDREWGNGRG